MKTKIASRPLKKEEIDSIRDHFNRLHGDNSRFIEVNRPALLTLRDELFIEMGLRLGYRINELSSILWKQIYDFKNDKVREDLTIAKKDMKGKKKARRCIISDNLKDFIKRFHDYWITIYNRELTPEDYVFQGIRSKTNRRMDNSTLHKRLIKVFQDCNLDPEGLSAHSLRKSFCENVYYNICDKDLVATAKITGHNNINNLQFYINPNRDEFDEKIKNMF